MKFAVQTAASIGRVFKSAHQDLGTGVAKFPPFVYLRSVVVPKILNPNALLHVVKQRIVVGVVRKPYDCADNYHGNDRAQRGASAKAEVAQKGDAHGIPNYCELRG
ncbi:MAG TPA: hypothetical protein VI282_19240 [Verrucomicrobiae bacterium]